MTLIFPGGGGLIPFIAAQQAAASIADNLNLPEGECKFAFTKDDDGVPILRADADSDWMFRVRSGNWWSKIRDDFMSHLDEHDFERIDLYEDGNFVHSWEVVPNSGKEGE